MQTANTTTANTITNIKAADKATKSKVNAILKARKGVKAGQTKGLLNASGEAITFFDLTTSQLNSAFDSAKFAFKSTARQQRLDMVRDAVAQAVADIVLGTHFWDSTKSSYYSCLRLRASYLLKAEFSKTAYKREDTSYSQAESDGDAVEFNYCTADLGPLETLEANEATANRMAEFSPKEQEYIKLVMLDTVAEEISELMGFASYAGFRVWRSKFVARNGLKEEMEAQISKSAKRKRAKK